MKIAILSDIHANFPALQEVQKDMCAYNVQQCWMLGDTVGYGPHPVESLVWLKNEVNLQNWVIGNHDAMLANLFSEDEWNLVNASAKIAIELNHTILRKHGEEVNHFWQTMFVKEKINPQWFDINNITYTINHGVQTGQQFMRYLYPWQQEFFLPAEFEKLFSQKNSHPVIAFYGHTHIPSLVEVRQDSMVEGWQDSIKPVKILPGQSYQLKSPVTIVNPGSVGQPRDLDRRASYLILDTEDCSVTFRRVAYDWRKTAQDMQDLDFPDALVRRLMEPKLPTDVPNEWRMHFERAKEMICEPAI
ncbi:MAG: metallophosphoesterase family protein [Chloroflexota bacterium]